MSALSKHAILQSLNKVSFWLTANISLTERLFISQMNRYDNVPCIHTVTSRNINNVDDKYKTILDCLH